MNITDLGATLGKPDEPNCGQETPWQKVQAQIRHLDRALTTIDGDFEESEKARLFITGQIEALKWAARLWEV